MNTCSGVLEVKVEKAILKKDVCVVSTMDPYFVASLQDGQTFRSKVKYNEGKLPIFNESFTFVTNLMSPCLSISVYHEKILIGECNVYLKDIVQRGNIIDSEIELKNQGTVEGKLKLRASYSSSNDSNPYNQISQGIHEINYNSFSNFEVKSDVNMNSRSNYDFNYYNYPGFESGSIPINPNAIPNTTCSNDNNDNRNNPSYLPKESFKTIYDQLGIRKAVETSSIENGNISYNNNYSNYGFQSSGTVTSTTTTNIYENISLRGINYNYTYTENSNQNSNSTNNNENNFNSIYNHLNINQNSNFNRGVNLYSNKTNMHQNNENIYQNNNSNGMYNVNNQIDQDTVTSIQQLNQVYKFESEEWYKLATYLKTPVFFKGNSEEIYCFDFTKRQWEQLSNSMKCIFPNNFRATELADGSFFITGGEYNGKILKNVIQYFPILGGYTEKANMNFERASHSAISNKDFVYVFGGLDASNTPTNSVERYDMINGEWKVLQKMAHPRSYASLLNYGEKYIFIIGGLTIPAINGRSESDIIERYDIEQDSFSEFNLKLRFPVYGCITAMISPELIFIGGGRTLDNRVSDNAYALNLLDGSVKDFPPLIKKCWTTQPAFYDKRKSSLEIFYNGEQADHPPEVISYQIRIPYV